MKSHSKSKQSVKNGEMIKHTGEYEFGDLEISKKKGDIENYRVWRERNLSRLKWVRRDRGEIRPRTFLNFHYC